MTRRRPSTDELAALLPREADRCETPTRLLLADHDLPARSRLVSRICDAAGEIVVLEAADGAEAIQLGLQLRPAVALLEVEMPRLGGIEAATVLRQLRPQMRLAVYAANPVPHRESAQAQELPLFNERKLDQALAWVRTQVAWFPQTRGTAGAAGKLDLSCTGCGYGILRSTPPERCPMCRAENAWTLSASRQPAPMLSRA